MAAVAGISLTTKNVFTKASEFTKSNPTKFSLLNSPWKRSAAQFRLDRMRVCPVAATPDKLLSKVEESIKNATETCSNDPMRGECAAARDEVEELSAAISHAKDKNKNSDPLETYCKDNPETNECRTYDN